MSKAVKRSFERRPREERMAAIEAAARTVFAKHGFQAAAVQEIASLAEVSEGTIYKFYASKSDLLHTIVGKWYQQCINHHVGQISPIMDTRIKLETLVRQHMSALVENPDLSILMFSEIRHFDDYRSSELFQLNRQYARILSEVLEEGIRRGELRDDISVPLIRDFIFGGIEHHITNFLHGTEEVNVRQIARQMIEMLWHGIERPVAPSGIGGEAVLERLEAVAGRLEKLSGDG